MDEQEAQYEGASQEEIEIYYATTYPDYEPDLSTEGEEENE